MTRLSWGVAGSRYYESGTDRGVLYVDTAGYPWSGLKAVNETPSGGESKPYYLDGSKYLNISALEEFEATIDAFSAPPEFALCDGTYQVYAGLFITQQPRKLFGLCYRTLIGNDVAGGSLGYKIHIVYNALAAPANRSNSSISDQAGAVALSWSITTRPADGMSGVRPTSHLMVDTRYTTEAKITALEAILYGSASAAARLPTVLQVATIFAS